MPQQAETGHDMLTLGSQAGLMLSFAGCDTTYTALPVHPFRNYTLLSNMAAKWHVELHQDVLGVQ